MRLAALMNCTLAELGERMSAEEFGSWNVFLETEPMGPASLLPVLAELLCALANGPLKPPSGRSLFRAGDFLNTDRWQLPASAPKPVEMTSHDIAALFKPR